MTTNASAKLFSITHSRYRTLLNVCIAAALFVSIAPQFFHLTDWFATFVVVSATGFALALRFLATVREDDVDGNVRVAETADLHQLPVLIPPRKVVPWQKSASRYHLIHVAYLSYVNRLEGLVDDDPEATNQFIGSLLLHKPLHHKVPQTERMKLFLLNEFAGGEDNPWMMNVPIGMVNLRIRGDSVELHIEPVHKKTARESQPEARSVLRDFIPSKIGSIVN